MTSFPHTWLNNNQTVSAWKRWKCPPLRCLHYVQFVYRQLKGEAGPRWCACFAFRTASVCVCVISKNNNHNPKGTAATASMVTMGRRWSWLIWHRDTVLQHATASFPSRGFATYLRTVSENHDTKTSKKGTYCVCSIDCSSRFAHLQCSHVRW